MLRTYKIEDIGDYGVIYLLTSPSCKYYVGQSWNVKRRWSGYRNTNTKKKKLYALDNALLKYGQEKFTYEIIDLCSTQGEMDSKEIFYIELYDSKKNGYNIRDGGSHGKLSEETKRKLSFCHTGEKNWTYGKPRSADFKEKLSNAISGDKHYFYGKTRTDEYKREMSEKLKGDRNGFYGKNHTEECKLIMKNKKFGKKLSVSHRNNISKANTGSNNPNFGRKHTKEEIDKIIEASRLRKWRYLWILTDPQGNIIYLKNLNYFCKLNNLLSSSFSNMLSGRLKTYKGWKVSRDELNSSNSSLAQDKDLFPN